MSNSGYRIMVVGIAACVLILAVGCSGPSMIFTGGKMMMNVAKGGSNIRVSLDGEEARQSRLKKAVKGHSSWKIGTRVSQTPTLRFRFIKPEKLGRITSTIINIFQEYKGGYSNQAEFIIAPRDNKPESQLKPNTNYNLGKLPDHLKVMDVRGNELKTLRLKPNTKYKMILAIRADKSEMAIVEFRTL